MALGYSGELFFLAFDHRASFAREVLGTKKGLTDAQVDRVRDAKRMLFDGLLRAVSDGAVLRDQAAVLVDEQFGGDVLRLALERGVAVAIAVERSGRQVFELEHGAEFREHLESIEPTFAKALVRFNVEGEPEDNARQLERLRTLSDYLVSRACKLMYELLVPPTAAQLGQTGEDRDRFARERRPELIVKGMAAAQEAGIEPDVWKVEGVDAPEDAAALVERARSGSGREDVGLFVLGAGASDERIAGWLDVAARTEGYRGFAIGRSIWRDAAKRYLDGELARDEAAATVALRFGALVARWRDAKDARSSTDQLEHDRNHTE